MTIDLRPCEISGEPALFHMWAVTDDFLLKIDAFIPADELFAINRRVRETGAVPNICNVTKISKVSAVVEWPDGSVTLEPAESVRFTDREEGDDA